MYSKTRAIIFALLVMLPAITFAENKQETCLAKTVYYECRGCKNINEKYDIAKLVINRTKHKKFPKTICGVVNQKTQFKWVSNQYPIKELDSWDESKQIAKQILKNPNISSLNEDVVFFKLSNSNVKLANNISKVKFRDHRVHSFFMLKDKSL